jgi:hypothetical protein
MECLRQYSQENSNLKIRMNFPGLGDGGLPVDEVVPLLLPLPPTVTICHKGEVQRSYPLDFPGFKSIYLRVEGMILERRDREAVEYLIQNGFDIQSAMEQVRAVERCMRERTMQEAEHVRHWRSSRVHE